MTSKRSDDMNSLLDYLKGYREGREQERQDWAWAAALVLCGVVVKMVADR